MRRIRKGDKVMIMAGRDRGKDGVVRRVLEDGMKLIVENANMVKRHRKPRPDLGEPGGMIEQEAPLHVSNVALINPTTGKADRVGFKTLGDGRKVRYYKSNGEVADN